MILPVPEILGVTANGIVFFDVSTPLKFYSFRPAVSLIWER
jgi:hypothetical protein